MQTASNHDGRNQIKGVELDYPPDAKFHTAFETAAKVQPGKDGETYIEHLRRPQESPAQHGIH